MQSEPIRGFIFLSRGGAPPFGDFFLIAGTYGNKSGKAEIPAIAGTLASLYYSTLDYFWVCYRLMWPCWGHIESFLPLHTSLRYSDSKLASPPRGGGGGECHFHIDGVGDVPLDRVWFSSHHHWHRISKSAKLATPFITGLLPSPVFMSGPRSRHQWRCVRDETDFYECMRIHWRIESPSVPVPTNLESTLDRELLSPSHRVCIWKFLVRYIVTGCIFCAPSGFRQDHRPMEVPLPPPHPPGHHPN